MMYAFGARLKSLLKMQLFGLLMFSLGGIYVAVLMSSAKLFHLVVSRIM